jgi:hypothetical protein
MTTEITQRRQTVFCDVIHFNYGPIEEPAQREVRYTHRLGTAASFAQEIEGPDRRRPADIAAHG